MELLCSAGNLPALKASIDHQVKQLARVTPVVLEVFAFGRLCIIAEGPCHLSSCLTGESPNTVELVHLHVLYAGSKRPPAWNRDSITY